MGEEVATTWKDFLRTGKDKKPRANLANALVALRRAPDWVGSFGYDLFSCRVMVLGVLPWSDGRFTARREWTDNDDLKCTEWLQRHDILVNPNIAAQAVNVVARERPFHDVRDYLNGLKWDGVPRLDTWAINYFGVEDIPFTRAVSSCWLKSGVARIFRPGAKVDHTLILEGRQGLKKSSAIEVLACGWFTDEVGDLGSKDCAMQLAGTLIVEFSELEALLKSKAAQTKAFLTRTKDRYRPPYGHRVETFPRQCIFAGTSNSGEYLTDETGARRFWPLECTYIDIQGLTAVRDQLWAEAKARFDQGEIWWLDDEELITAATEAQRARYQADPWQSEIAKFIVKKEDVSVEEILGNCLCLDQEKWTQRDKNRVAKSLVALDWERFQKRIGNDRAWLYQKKKSPVSQGQSPPIESKSS